MGRRRKAEADPARDAFIAAASDGASPSASRTETLPPVPGSDGSASAGAVVTRSAPPPPVPALQSARVVHGPSRTGRESDADQAAEGREVVDCSALHGPQPAAFPRPVHGPARRAEPVEVTVPTIPDPPWRPRVTKLRW